MRTQAERILTPVVLLLLVLALTMLGIQYHNTKKIKYDSFKRGCMVQGGSLQLCNVMSTEYVRSK
jgi:hypothetical protein